MAKLPSFMFYPGDWMKDANLRRCSPAARGVWMDMLCLMFECERRGVLATSGVAWTVDEIACAVGGNQDVTVSCVQELLAKGVCGRAKRTGRIWSRRMVRDERIRRLRARVGAIGGSKPKAKPKAKRKQTPEIESEESSSPASPEGGSGGKPRNPVWDAVAALWFGGDVKKPHRARVGKLVSDFNALEATADGIQARHREHLRRWPGYTPSPDSIIKHWHELGSVQPSQGGHAANVAHPHGAPAHRANAASRQFAEDIKL